MADLNMCIEVALLCKSTPTVRFWADMSPSLIELKASVYDLNMAFQSAFGGAFETTLYARWRMLVLNMGL
jgi:uncharacterized membrane protein